MRDSTVRDPVPMPGNDSLRMTDQKDWRRGPGSNRRIKVLQTSPLPLGYRAAPENLFVYHEERPARERLERETGLEPATLALARRCSTTELLPLGTLASLLERDTPVNR